jgi:hypothetical protein
MPITVGNFNAGTGTTADNNLDRMAATRANKNMTSGEKITEYENIAEDNKANESCKETNRKITDMYSQK